MRRAPHSGLAPEAHPAPMAPHITPKIDVHPGSQQMAERLC